ncbi:Dynamin-2B [Acorus calamus]|uniref:Dynamin-2B n=1 Tax=Acorus calamus TaxID=4465 RepID=A0AAV9C852_ACOCL|nr:Dynamin-2B [Acorus calamus]
MEAIEDLVQLPESMLQASALLADETSMTRRRREPYLGENGATRAPISIDLQRDASISIFLIVTNILMIVGILFFGIFV